MSPLYETPAMAASREPSSSGSVFRALYKAERHKAERHANTSWRSTGQTPRSSTLFSIALWNQPLRTFRIQGMLILGNPLGASEEALLINLSLASVNTLKQLPLVSRCYQRFTVTFWSSWRQLTRAKLHFYFKTARLQLYANTLVVGCAGFNFVAPPMCMQVVQRTSSFCPLSPQMNYRSQTNWSMQSFLCIGILMPR